MVTPAGSLARGLLTGVLLALLRGGGSLTAPGCCRFGTGPGSSGAWIHWDGFKADEGQLLIVPGLCCITHRPQLPQAVADRRQKTARGWFSWKTVAWSFLFLLRVPMQILNVFTVFLLVVTSFAMVVAVPVLYASGEDSGRSNRLILLGSAVWIGLVLLNWGMSVFVA